MHNPITFMPTEPMGNSAKQIKSNLNNSQSGSNSFNQLLSKEISEKNNASNAKSTNKLENKIIKQNNDAKPQAPNNSEKNSVKADDNSEDKLESESNTTPAEGAPTNGAQLIAFVDSLAQLTTQISTTKQNTIAKDVAAFDASSPVVATNIAPSLTDVMPLKSDQKTESLPSKVSFAEKLIKAEELSPVAATDDSEASITSLPAMIKELPDVIKDVKPGAIQLAVGEMQNDSKPSSKFDFNVELKTDVIAEPQTTLSKNTNELGLKAIDLPPSVQHFAQQIALSSGLINDANPIEHLAPRVGTSAWNQSVGQKIIWMVAGGLQTAELTLSPPDLGPMQVVLSVNNDQANATFISNHSDVREALESAMPKLRQMMSDAGVQLSSFSVKSDSANQGSQFSRERSFSGSKNNNAETVSGIGSIKTTTITSRSTSTLGIVDTFA